MATLILIDATAFVFRAYHAMRPLTSADGVPTGALFGYSQMVMSLVRESGATHAAAVFDAPGPSFRDELYGEYKANRPECPEAIRIQIPLCMEFSRLIGLPVFSETGFEADDIIATLARKWPGEQDRIVVYSADKDLMQLVDGRVSLYDPMRGKWYDPQGVFEKFQVRPSQMGDYLALVGDASDNVPGVPGIGARTASKLLAEHGTLEEILEAARHPERIPGRTGEALRAHEAQARLSRRLVTLHEDVPLDVRLPDGLLLQPALREELKVFLTRYGFSRLLRELDIMPRGAARDTLFGGGAPSGTGGNASSAPEAPGGSPEGKPVLLSREEDSVSGRRTASILVWVDFARRHPRQFEVAGICWRGVDGTWENHRFSDGFFAYGPSWREAMERIRPHLEDPSCLKIAIDCKGLWWLCEEAGIRLQGRVEDPLCAVHMLDSATPVEDLAAFWKARGRTENPAENPEPMQELAQGALSGIERHPRAQAFFRDVEMPLHGVLAGMERTGVKVDVNVLARIRSELGAQALQLEQELHRMAGSPINLASPRQLQKFLFEDLKLPTARKTKTGFSTDAEVLEELALQHEAPALIVRHRFLSKLQNTYLDVLPRLVFPGTGRIHGQFQTRLASTGRISSVEPNLQNIPVRTPEGRRIREAFVAPPGMVLLSCDYSQIELRVLAHFCEDPGLMDAFVRGIDIHRRTAAEVFGVAEDAVTPEQRAVAKEVNFGVLYGQTGFGLARTLGISLSEARAIIERYFDRYPRVRETLDRLLADGLREGYMETLGGRRRSARMDPNPRTRSAQERTLVNFPIQGTAADILKSAMVACDAFLRREAPEIRMVLTVHDELVFEVPEDRVQEAAGRLKSIMASAFLLRVPLEVSASWGPNWSAAH